MAKYSVSYLIRAFAYAVVDAESEEQAIELAIKTPASELNVEDHTIEVDSFESVQEMR